MAYMRYYNEFFFETDAGKSCMFFFFRPRSTATVLRQNPTVSRCSMSYHLIKGEEIECTRNGKPTQAKFLFEHPSFDIMTLLISG